MLCLQDGQDTFRFAHLTFQDRDQPLRFALDLLDVSGVRVSGFLGCGGCLCFNQTPL